MERTNHGVIEHEAALGQRQQAQMAEIAGQVDGSQQTSVAEKDDKAASREGKVLQQRQRPFNHHRGRTLKAVEQLGQSVHERREGVGKGLCPVVVIHGRQSSPVTVWSHIVLAETSSQHDSKEKAPLQKD